MATRKTAVIEVKTYHAEPVDRVWLVSQHPDRESAELEITELNRRPQHYDLGQATGYYLAVPVVQDRIKYQDWLEGQNWVGCPHPGDVGPDEHRKNCEWAEQRAVDDGGKLPVWTGSFGLDLVLVQMPGRERGQQCVYCEAGGLDPAESGLRQHQAIWVDGHKTRIGDVVEVCDSCLALRQIDGSGYRKAGGEK